MKLKLDVINKWQEPPEEEVETIKFWVKKVNKVIHVGATLPNGEDIVVGFFELDNDGKRIRLALMNDLPKEYFRKDIDGAYIYTY